MDSNNIIEAAIQLATERGWYLLPCKGKRPLIAWKEGSTNDVDEIRRWDSLGVDSIGVDTGKSGLVVLDVDTESWGAETSLPTTLQVRTPRGRHYYYQATPGVSIRNTASKIARGVDVRGEGGFAILPPSPGYMWQTHAPIGEPPLQLFASLEDTNESSATKTLQSFSSGTTTAYGLRALEANIGRILTSAVGRRNDILNIAAYNIGRLVASGEIEQTEAYSKLTHAAELVGLSNIEIRETIASGMQAGEREPWNMGEEPLDPDAETTWRLGSDLGTLPARQYILSDFIPTGTVTLCVGPAGIGKTTFCKSVLSRLTTGGLDGDFQGGSVIISSFEESDADICSTFTVLAGDISKLAILDPITATGDKLAKYLESHLDPISDQTGMPVRAIVLDGIKDFMRGRGDNPDWDSLQVRQFLTPLNVLARTHNLAIICVTHPPKAGGQSTSGSAAWQEVPRQVLYVTNSRVKVSKSNYGNLDKTLHTTGHETSLGWYTEW